MKPPGTGAAPFATLLDALRAHAEAGVAHTVGAAEDVWLTYPDLWGRVGACATRLSTAGVRPGDHVAVEMGTSTAVLCAALGVLASGAVLVPVGAVRSPRPDSVDSQRLMGVVRASGARWYLTPEDPETRRRMLGAYGAKVEVVPVEGLAAAGEVHALPGVVPEQAALLQFSSGSLAAPKGIVLSHRNLVANMWAFLHRIGLLSGRGVTWLPLSHDMGLIGSFLGCLYGGSAFHASAPSMFVRDPLRWLEEMAAFGATHSSGPPFALDLVIRRAERSPARLAGLDLSALRAIVIGSERIPPHLCERFETVLAPCGLRRHTLLPGYGLAENCLAVALREPLVPSSVIAADPVRLERGRLTQAATDEAGPARARPLIGHGEPLQGTEIRIVSSNGIPVGPGLVGEIRIGGDAACQWLVGPDGSRRPARGPDGLVPTGDLGSFIDGELYVVGRIKETLKHAGRTIAPADVEQAALDAAPDLLAAAAAVATGEEDTADRLVLFLEVTRRLQPPEEARLADGVRLAVLRDFGMPTQAVYVGRRGALPRTTSGKVRRLSLAGELRSGRLARCWSAVTLAAVPV
ncbi:AMP-binding protein [Streptomyces sp. NPDC006627]|uniref:AMP-binding protein n=1 Tax=Streptomyces sp. NPDC006627 TaxID=3154679 RepID=UPI0033A9BBFC